MKRMIQREIEVAFSIHSQPVWFRILKWIVIILGVYFFYGDELFLFGVIMVSILSLAVHLLWRYKTKGWTQSWFLWNYEKNKPKV